jgi:hypothetical protein
VGKQLRRFVSFLPVLGSLRNRNLRLEIGGGVFKSLLLDSRDAHNMAAVISAMSSSFLFRVGFRAKGNRFVEVASVQTLCTAEAPEMGTIDLFDRDLKTVGVSPSLPFLLIDLRLDRPLVLSRLFALLR